MTSAILSERTLPSILGTWRSTMTIFCSDLDHIAKADCAFNLANLFARFRDFLEGLISGLRLTRTDDAMGSRVG
jgi:hypothetical protein